MALAQTLSDGSARSRIRAHRDLFDDQRFDKRVVIVIARKVEQSIHEIESFAGLLFENIVFAFEMDLSKQRHQPPGIASFGIILRFPCAGFLVLAIDGFERGDDRMSDPIVHPGIDGSKENQIIRDDRQFFELGKGTINRFFDDFSIVSWYNRHWE